MVMKRAAVSAGRQNIAAFASARANELIARLGKEVERSRSEGDPDAIHDLRVSVRRLSQCLDVFADMFPGKSALRVRKRIRRIRRLAGEVRDRDIAIELLDKISLPSPDGFADRIREERTDAYAKLVSRLDRISNRGRIAAWSKDLALEAQA